MAESEDIDPEKMSDPQYRREKLYEILVDSDIPMWREIGTQLRSGAMRPADMLSNDHYRAFILTEFDQAKDGFAARLDSYLDALNDDETA